MPRYIPKEEALGNPVRRAILDRIAAQPGISLSQLANDMACKPSTILWHTGKLTKADLLRSTKANGLRMFYVPAGGSDLRERIVTGARLGNPLARRIHEVVAQRPGITFKGISAAVAENVSALRWHVTRLVEEGLLCPGDGPGRALRYYARHHAGLPRTPAGTPA